MKLNLKCLIVFFILLIVEIIIGVFVRDAIIRPYVGDILVVILMYAFIRGIIKKACKVFTHIPFYFFVYCGDGSIFPNCGHIAFEEI